jgi:HEPN domain-containing protein
LLAARKPPLRDSASFHCQQAAEKYMKALLQELGTAFPKTHDLDTLVKLLLPDVPTLARFRRRLDALTSYAVEYRYPIVRASTRQMRSALRTAEAIRNEIRLLLKLPI